MPTIAQIVGETVATTTTIQHIHSRQTFAAQRSAALEKQRDGIQARLDNLRSEIRKVREKGRLLNDVALLKEAIAKVDRMSRAEAKLVDDITRLTAKIGD